MTSQSSSDGPIVSEVRERARKISERFANDPRKYLEHLKAAQQANPSHLVGQMTVAGNRRN